jgi:hypothetical protein
VRPIVLSFIDERGAVRDFTSMDELATLSGGFAAAPWHPPIEGWHSVSGPSTSHPRLGDVRA